MRRWLTAGATRATWKLAPIAPKAAIDVLERVLGRIGPRLPVLARMVESNMRAAGVYDRAALDEYFRQVALHLANAARIFRDPRGGGAVSEIAQREIVLDATIEYVHQAAKQGRGAIIVPAHACNFLIALARLGQDLPICIYLRWSKDRHRLDMKRQWCEAAGLDVIVEPANVMDPTSQAAACIDAIREGKILVITPDIAQRATDGVPVQWLGRTAYLPAGPAALAMLAEVPMIPLFARLAVENTGGTPVPQPGYDRAPRRGTAPSGTGFQPVRASSDRPIQVLAFAKPIMVNRLSRADGGRKEAIRRAMQTWADGFSGFIRDCPPAWLLWGDSRWTRVFRGDPKYAGAAEESMAQEATPPRHEAAERKETA